MKISELIIKLEEVKSIEGDINVCLSEKHEYWGSIQRYLSDIEVSNFSQPFGPKSGKSERAVVFEY